MVPYLCAQAKLRSGTDNNRQSFQPGYVSTSLMELLVVRTYLNMYVASVAPFGLKVHSRSESPAVIALGILHACRVLNCDKSVLEVERADLFILGAKHKYFAFALRSNSSVASW